MSNIASGLQLRLLDNLKLFRERLTEEREQRKLQHRGSLMSFGVPFLDEALGGIHKNDLIVYGAKSGVGKTQLASITALANAKQGKRVHFFALEAEPNEIERRLKYQILADAFFKILRRQYPDIHLNYMDWCYGKFEKELGMVEVEIEDMLRECYPNLWTFYRTADFTIADFETHFNAIQDQTDLVIIDHLHYFDFEDENENRALKKIVKKIRDLAILIGKPVILVAHMRKSDRRAKQVAPGLDEFHGSSDITKIATKVITIAPNTGEPNQGNRWMTYVRVPKCRIDGSRTKLVGLLGFNADTQLYEQPYCLGRLSSNEEEFEPITLSNEMPFWAMSGKVANGNI